MHNDACLSSCAFDSMDNALVCISKNEDHYIDEWLQYHLKLGFSKIFVYQNDWRYSGDKPQYSNSVQWIEFDGNCMQVNAYNDFIDNRSNGVSFAGFIDVDEFLCLKADSSLEQFLLRYIDCYGFCVNWKLFGDNGISDVVDNDWSVIKRFTKCQRTMNKHVKTFLNIGRCGKAFHFVNPHCVDASLRFNCIVDPSKQVFVHGPWNEKSSNDIAQLNHYHSKTLGEYRLKNIRGRADMRNMTASESYTDQKFSQHNFNEMTDTTVLDFWNLN